MNKISKSQLSFLLREALEHGQWVAEDVNPANETYRRGPRVITIASRATASGEYAFTMRNEATEMSMTSKDSDKQLAQRLIA